ncbi:unnamed protein product [Cuscuta europaea]|uniref:Uncharacterized protein n=1 Tax=Cuscuta europaea TaxID=41803 RepID=A0A9P1DZ59_CUSEU|nr:unnamed protein product [Cuscuta europaea]
MRRGNHSSLAKDFNTFSNWDLKGKNQNIHFARGKQRDSRDRHRKGLLRGFDNFHSSFRKMIRTRFIIHKHALDSATEFDISIEKNFFLSALTNLSVFPRSNMVLFFQLCLIRIIYYG